MKKIMTLILGLMLLASLAGCGKGEEPKPTDTPAPPPAESKLPEESKTPESAEPSVEPSAEPSAPVSGEAAVSGELFDNQFELEGTVFTMPISVSELAPLGFGVQEDKKDFVLNANTFTSGRVQTADGKQKIAVGFYNLGAENISLSESKLSSVNLNGKSLEGMSFSLAKGITLGSSVDEVKAAYGEPTNFIDGGPAAKVLRERMVYKNADDSRNYYELSFEDKLLVGAEIYVNSK